MQVVCWIIGILLGLCLLFALAGALFFFDYAVRRKPMKVRPEDPNSPWAYLAPRVDQGKAWIRSCKAETLHITSQDGLRLTAHLLEPKEKTGRVMVMMHGFRSLPVNDFAVSARYFYEAGYAVLLCDQRAHGESEGKYLTFGVKERYDCRDWAALMAERYGAECRVFLMGVSMGAATVLMALGLDLPKNVKAVVADCGYTTPKAIFAHVLKAQYHLPCFPVLYAAGLLCRARAGFGLGECSTLSALEHNKIPVFFLHGGKDNFVPRNMTEQNYQACSARKKRMIVEQAEHAMSFVCAPENCFRAIHEFLNGCRSAPQKREQENE